MTERQTDDIARYATERRKRGTVRKIALLVVLVLLLMLFAWSAAYYAQNRRLPFRSPLGSVTRDEVLAPEYLYSISGPETEDALKQPLGVAIKGDQMFVVDGTARVVRCFDTDGGYNFSFSAIQSDKGTALELPARVTIGPDGNVWVTDRRLPGIFVFDPDDGSFVREFVPTSDIVNDWGPLALAFNEQGDLYVADVGRSKLHRIVAFDSAGNEIARWGETAPTTNPQQSPGKFFYPNGIAFDKDGNVYVSDMSNHRVQIFSATGEFKAIIPSSGSPLGVVMDPEQRLYVVDPFAHTVDIYSTKDGRRITGFGQPGYGLGQFRFPNDIALDENNRIYVSDRENYQVQVWGWPTGLLPPVELPKKPLEWVICLSPLLLLLIPLLRRRTKFMTTADFLETMISIEGAVPKMDDRRFKWVVTEAVYAAYERREVEGVDLGDLLDGQPYSRTDVEDFMEKSGADEATAIVLTMAERVGRLATEDEALAEAAGALDIRVTDAERFLEDYAGGRSATAARRSG